MFQFIISDLWLLSLDFRFINGILVNNFWQILRVLPYSHLLTFNSLFHIYLFRTSAFWYLTFGILIFELWFPSSYFWILNFYFWYISGLFLTTDFFLCFWLQMNLSLTLWLLTCLWFLIFQFFYFFLFVFSDIRFIIIIPRCCQPRTSDFCFFIFLTLDFWF